MKILVTGGAGFIGHHLVRGLLERGHEVSIIDDLSTGSRARLEAFRGDTRAIEGSILDADVLDSAMEGAQVVLHEAAIASVARSFDAPLLSEEVNARGTIAVMLAAVRAGVGRVVFAGSSSAYGTPERLPCVESMPNRPESPYGASKLAAEQYLHTLGRFHGIETVSLRYFNVFGPGQDPLSDYAAVIPLFVTAVLDGRRPTIYGTGDVTRDFTFVENVVDANIRAATTPDVGHLTCNVACGERTSLLGLLDAICSAAGRQMEPIFGPPRPGDIHDSLADITLARRHLGYEVSVPFREGIERTVAWYRDQGQAAPAR